MTRWKTLAGLFAVTVGGMVAFADPPATPCPATPKIKTAAQPVVSEFSLRAITTVNGSELEVPKDLLPSPITLPENKPAVPPPPPAFNFSTALPNPPSQIVPVPTVGKIPSPPPTAIPLPVPEPAKPIVAVKPKPNSDITEPPAISWVSKPEALPRVPTPAVGTVAAIEKIPVPIVTTLNLGDGKPRFEVKNGDIVQLKVVCTHIDTTAAEQGPEQTSLIRASGKVWFAAPGCEGSCEELRFNQSTGEVILAKSITVVCKLNKSETVLRSEQMTFKIGSPVNPAGTVPEISSIKMNR